MGALMDHVKKTGDRQSVLHKVSGYDANCSSGFRVPGFCQIHHIVCVSSIAGRSGEYPPGKFEFIEACLWVTNWDLNAGHNLIGLPLNKQYRASDGQRPVNKPSHQVDHNTREGYTAEVSKYLSENVWNGVTAQQKPHKVNIKSLEQELKGASDEFRQRLKDRGKRQGGTKKCWAHRWDREYRTRWYHPFSMGKKPSRRHPGLRSKRMTHIFKKLDK